MYFKIQATENNLSLKSGVAIRMQVECRTLTPNLSIFDHIAFLARQYRFPFHSNFDIFSVFYFSLGKFSDNCYRILTPVQILLPSKSKKKLTFCNAFRKRYFDLSLTFSLVRALFQIF